MGERCGIGVGLRMNQKEKKSFPPFKPPSGHFDQGKNRQAVPCWGIQMESPRSIVLRLQKRTAFRGDPARGIRGQGGGGAQEARHRVRQRHAHPSTRTPRTRPGRRARVRLRRLAHPPRQRPCSPSTTATTVDSSSQLFFRKRLGSHPFFAGFPMVVVRIPSGPLDRRYCARSWAGPCAPGDRDTGR